MQSNSNQHIQKRGSSQIILWDIMRDKGRIWRSVEIIEYVIVRGGSGSQRNPVPPGNGASASNANTNDIVYTPNRTSSTSVISFRIGISGCR
mmetsp:Transcript_12103/g.18745  ORF Transcript_12103/g.18745 Transcript_12103/m.18745 type:complete len:92 (-) Transcript_12103:1981-2256(-)